jgi:competence protein ComEA
MNSKQETNDQTAVSQPPGHRLPNRADIRVVGLVVVAFVALALFWWWTGRPGTEALAPVLQTRPASQEQDPRRNASEESVQPTSGAQQPVSEELNSPTESQVVVDVRGGVRSRGIQRLPVGSRVVDAIAAAGGLRVGRSMGQVNLAAVLVDGEQINVNRQRSQDIQPLGPKSNSSSAAATATSSASGGSSQVALNSATAMDLESLPGVGPVLANRIIEWREQNGDFRSVDELTDVSGIGSKVLQGLRDSVRVE